MIVSTVFRTLLRLPRWGRVLAMACSWAVLIASGCDRGAPKTTVSGKVAYRGMAIEEARISAFRAGGVNPREVASTRSGYHGSWVLRLSPGRYRLEATATLPQGGHAPLSLSGRLAGVRVESGRERVDRLLIQLGLPAPPPQP